MPESRSALQQREELKVVNAGRRTRFLIFSCVAGIQLLLAVLVSHRLEHCRAVFELSNYLGPVTKGLADTGKMVMFRSGPPYFGSVPFYGARMPFAVYLLLILNKVLGGNFFAVQACKTFLLAVPLFIASWLALNASPPGRKNLVTAIMLLPFGIPGFLLLTSSLQIEEAYFYSFLALAVALLIYANCCRLPMWLVVWVFAICLDLVYLTKTSMRVSCFVLLASMLFRLRNLKLGIVLCLLTAIAPLGWGCYLLRTTGHFTFGSSLDGFNFHKGNYPEFLKRYPPDDNKNLDKWDPTITPRLPMFRTEWEDSAYHMRLGLQFVRQPSMLLAASLRKIYVYFLDLRDIGSGHQNDLFARLDLVNMILFRLITWGALLWSVGLAIRGDERFVAVSFLLFVVASSLPYIVGFALTRHASILIYPSAIVLAYYASRTQKARVA